MDSIESDQTRERSEMRVYAETIQESFDRLRISGYNSEGCTVSSRGDPVKWPPKGCEA